MTAWIILLAAGGLEIVWAAALKASQGFSRPLPSLVGVVAAALSLFLLSVALCSLPVSLAYAVWVSIGTAGVAVYGMVILNEPFSAVRALALLLIGIGVISLVATSTST